MHNVDVEDLVVEDGGGALAAAMADVWAGGRHGDAVVVCAGGAAVRAPRLVLAGLSHLLGRAMLDDDGDTCCSCSAEAASAVVLAPDVDAADLSAFLGGVCAGGVDEAVVPDTLAPLGITADGSFKDEDENDDDVDDPGGGHDHDDEDFHFVPSKEKDESVDCEYSNRRQKSSAVDLWSFFERSAAAATCVRCSHRVPRTSGLAARMKSHLRRSHPDLHGLLAKKSKLRDEDSDFWPDDGSDPDIRTTKKVSKLRKKKKKKAAKGGKSGFGAVLDLFEVTAPTGRASSKIRTYKCKSCQESIRSTSSSAASVELALLSHVKTSHGDAYAVVVSASGVSEEEADAELERYRSAAAAKEEADEEEESLASRTCPECGKVYSRRKGMETHLEAVHSGRRPFVCSECGAAFARKESLARHFHGDARPFLCSLCGKTFARRHIRDVHERAHRGDRRYACAYCEKRFLTNQKKTVHERIHTGEKPFECEVCHRRFVQKHQLQTHSRIHTGARPYSCDRCDQVFRHLSTKAKHACPGGPKAEETETHKNKALNRQHFLIPGGRPSGLQVVSAGGGGGEPQRRLPAILSASSLRR